MIWEAFFRESTRSSSDEGQGEAMEIEERDTRRECSRS